MRLGITELIVIVLVAVALLKPEKLKDYMAYMKKAAKTYSDTKKEVSSEVQEIVDPITDTNKELQSALKGEL